MRGRLRRSRRERVLGGVCAGLADWLGWEPRTLRILFVVGTVIPVLPGAVVYAVLWLIVPAEELPSPAGPARPAA